MSNQEINSNNQSFSYRYYIILLKNWHETNVNLMLAHRLRRWASIKSTLVQRMLLTGSVNSEGKSPRPILKGGFYVIRLMTIIGYFCFNADGREID